MRLARKMRRERGFTIIEVLVALAIMTIGMLGILAIYKGQMSASGYSRRATEAAVLAEDKLEQLRTAPITTAIDGNDRIDSKGVANLEGPFDRTWTLEADGTGTLTTITVAVAWSEGDGNHSLTFRTLRNLN
jgi:type IV pilus assembly protein PilV